MKTAKDENEAKKIIVDLKDHFSNFHNQCKEADDLYNLTYKVKKVKGFQGIKPETPTIAINQAATQIDTANIRVEVPPRNETSTAQQQANIERRALLGFWHMIQSNHEFPLSWGVSARIQFSWNCATAWRLSGVANLAGQFFVITRHHT